MESLSIHDTTVLNTIFDPFHFEQEFEQIQFANKQDAGLEGYSEVLNESVEKLVKEAITCAENQQFDNAFRLFEEALDKMPHSPTILNDRAQALRLASRDKEALADLDLAIKLSEGSGKAGVRALCQRGILYRRFGREDEAREDFKKAAAAGSKFAESQLVAINPYAALCNAMLHKVFKSVES